MMMRSQGLLLAGALAIASGACSKHETKSEPASTDAAAASAAPSAKPEPKVTRWSGKYTSTAGTIFVPDGGEWAHTKWRGDESSEGLGKGELSLEADEGAVHGSLGGPLGPALLTGIVNGDQVTAHIARKDPHDGGFTGTLEGTVAGGSVKGTMHLSRATGDVIREASFELASTPAP